jgi:hypothetical protein
MPWSHGWLGTAMWEPYQEWQRRTDFLASLFIDLLKLAPSSGTGLYPNDLKRHPQVVWGTVLNLNCE